MVDNHHAAKAGVKSEKRAKIAISECGLDLLKKKAEYIRYYRDKEGGLAQWSLCQELKIPEVWKHLRNAKTKSGNKPKQYQPDGFIPQLNCRVEFKSSDAYGTTEDKVMYDLKKIERGTYSDKKLLYVFMGSIAEMQFVFDVFNYEMKLLDPNEEKVKVLFDSTPDLSILKAYLLAEHQSVLCLERQLAGE